MENAPERFVGREPPGLSLLTVTEAATRLEIPVGPVRTWLREDALAGTKVAGRWRVPAVVVAALLHSVLAQNNASVL